MKMKKNNFLRDLFKNIRFAVNMCYRASKKYFVLKCLISVCTTFIPIITVLLWKEILNGIATDITANRHTVITCLAVYAALTLLSYLIVSFDTYVNDRYMFELRFHVDEIMMKISSRMDLSFFDSASMGDKVQNARDNFNALEPMTWLVFQIISEFVGIITTFLFVASYNVWIGIATLLLCVPLMIHNKSWTEAELRRNRAQNRERRKMSWFYNVFADNNAQFEIKLNDIGSFHFKRLKEIWSSLYKINKREDIRHNIINAVILILNSASELLVLILSIFGVINKKIGIGDFQLNISMVSSLRDHASNLTNNMSQFLIHNTRLIDLQEFLALQPEIEKSGDLLPSANPRIEFCNVSFRYPNSEEYVLKDCSFTIEPHEKIGLIGLNGSGKSTIIKLLFRFYDPQEGTIKYDGVALKEYNVYAVRKIFGVLFQDYVTYCLPLREIIALSSFDDRFDDEKLRKACDISGVTGIISDWELGFDSVLGRYYGDNGKDLSGGQWQLVGLARAYFKDSEYMILDEPSASLDPISEDRIFNQLYMLSEGKSSVTISHRLSNTTLADKILVIDDGRIIEQGSHFELLKKDGKYAHLFNLQAEKYQ